jgi:Etoposide-induced protein 2.4 (EI24)
MSRLTSTLILSAGVTTFMFVFAYLPQAAIMAFTSGPLAAVSAALLTLSESSTIVNLISRTFLMQDALVDTFDGTLVSRECTDLVSDGRQVNAGRDPIARLGKLMTRPLAKFAPSEIIRYLLYLPLNFIPVVGTVMFVILQGKRNGPAAHARYFQLKKWSKSQREAFVEQTRGAYTSYVYSSTW